MPNDRPDDPAHPGEPGEPVHPDDPAPRDRAARDGRSRTGRAQRASELRDELRAAATEIRDELRDAAVEVRTEFGAAADEVGSETAHARDELREALATVRRSLAVVWGVDDPPTRGPRATLTREAIVEVGVRIADADGLDGVSMRAIAKELGVGTMSLYRHVPGKDELLTLMIDHVNGETPLVSARDGTWRERLEAFAWGEWHLAHAHPWLLSVPASMSRPVAGPNGLAAYESALSVAATTGLPPVDVVTVVHSVQFLVDGAAKASVDNALAAQRTGISNEQWWAAQAEVLEQVFDPARYPTFAALDAAGAFGDHEASDHTDPIDLTNAFTLGLASLLDGIAARIATHDVDDTGT